MNYPEPPSVCQELLSLCSTSSLELPTCTALLDKVDRDSLPEEQRIDFGVAVLQPSIGTAHILPV